MATAAKRKLAGPAPNGKRRWNNDRDEPQLTILRLDLNTITAQIKILEDELDADPCLSTDGTSTICRCPEAGTEGNQAPHRTTEGVGDSTKHLIGLHPLNQSCVKVLAIGDLS
jgi:hypothetical protein